MSLLRLLTAGKSLIGVPSTPSRYKLSDPRSMPKFRSTVNPFKSKTAKVEAAEAGPSQSPAPAPAPAPPIEKMEPAQEPRANDRPAEIAEIVRTPIDAAEPMETTVAGEPPGK